MAEDRGRVLAFPRAPDAIELRHLRSFVAVAEELNFGRAAEQLYLSQPAPSRQIRALEQLVGCQLFRRSTHRLELTLASPLLGDLSRMPPLLIQAGTGDPHCLESQALAREQGADARLELYPVATHVFQVFLSFLPEATEALESASRFVQEVSTARPAALPSHG